MPLRGITERVQILYAWVILYDFAIGKTVEIVWRQTLLKDMGVYSEAWLDLKPKYKIDGLTMESHSCQTWDMKLYSLYGV